MFNFTLEGVTQKVESVSRNLMKKAYKNNWKENTITENLCAELRELFGFKNNNTGKPIKIENTTFGESLFVLLDAHKIGIKEAEKKSGDVTGLVIFEDSGGIKGIGFFFWEAKRVFPSGKLESFKFSQLKTILGSNLYAKYLIYDPTKSAVGVINPRIFLFHRQHYKSDTPKIPASKVRAYSIDFPTYFCKNLLLGNDLMLLTKVQNYYNNSSYPPALLQFLSDLNIHESTFLNAETILDFVIRFFRDKVYSIPEYLILQANGTNGEPVNAVNLLKKIKENLKEDWDLKPVHKIGKGPEKDPEKDPENDPDNDPDNGFDFSP